MVGKYKIALTFSLCRAEISFFAFHLLKQFAFYITEFIIFVLGSFGNIDSNDNMWIYI